MLNDSFLFKKLKTNGERKIVRARVVQTAIIGVRKLQKKKSVSPTILSKRSSSKSKTIPESKPIEEP